MLFVTWCKIGLSITTENIPLVLKATYGMTISEGEVHCILDQIASVFKPYYDNMLEDMVKRPC